MGSLTETRRRGRGEGDRLIQKRFRLVVRMPRGSSAWQAHGGYASSYDRESCNSEPRLVRAAFSARASLGGGEEIDGHFAWPAIFPNI